ncbi:hypothetical protein BDF14DRAFT_1868383 [Spinellus fusiger]|nr:hypothetical protein BDF14DRAFT_1868383 [Spinellus fusiger]
MQSPISFSLPHYHHHHHHHSPGTDTSTKTLFHSIHTPTTQSIKRQKTAVLYQCSVCKKYFNRPSALQTHSYTHTGEKPFACDSVGCGRRFAVISNLRRHIKVHKKVKNIHLYSMLSHERGHQVQRLIEANVMHGQYHRHYPEPRPLQSAPVQTNTCPPFPSIPSLLLKPTHQKKDPRTRPPLILIPPGQLPSPLPSPRLFPPPSICDPMTQLFYDPSKSAYSAMDSPQDKYRI